MTPDILTDTLEQQLLAGLASQVPPGTCVVELGVFRGGSLAILAKNVPDFSNAVYGVDLFGAEGTPEYYREGSTWLKWWEWFAGKNHSYQDNYRAARAVAPTATIIVADTAETGRTWIGAPVGLLYIDADHSYEGVRADWEAWTPHMSEGAVVVFDDYRYIVRGQDHYPGVTKFVDELQLDIMTIGKAAVVRL